MSDQAIGWVATVIVCGLASWRLASLLHTEDAFGWLRKWIGIGNDTEGYPAIYPDTFWGKVFGCFWCLTLFTSGIVIGFVVLAATVHWMFLVPVWLASSSVAIVSEKQIMRTQSR